MHEFFTQYCLTRIRSRLVRLAESCGTEEEAVQRLLLFRLPSPRADALLIWQSILSGDDALWEGITEPYKESIRAFLLQFNQEILRRASKSFDWSGGSIGNFFFTGARLFFNSLEAAIFLFSRVARVRFLIPLHVRCQVGPSPTLMILRQPIRSLHTFECCQR